MQKRVANTLSRSNLHKLQARHPSVFATFKPTNHLLFQQSACLQKDNGDDKKNKPDPDDIVEDEEKQQENESKQQQQAPVSSVPVSKEAAYKAAVQSFFNVATPPFVEVLPLYKKPAFPGVVFPIVVHEGNLAKSLLSSGAEEKLVGLFLVREQERNRDSSLPINDVRSIENVGVLAKVVRVYTSKFGASVVLAGVRRIQVTGVVDNPGGRLTVKIQELKDILPAKRNNTYIQAYANEIIACMKELAQLNSFYKEQLTLFADQADFSNPSDLADVASLLTTPDASKVQEILATARIEDRLRKALELIKVELETFRIQAKIQKNLDEKISASQRKFYLNEQLKLIKKELGLEHDEKETLVNKFNERLEGKVVPEAANKVIQEEIAKLQTLEPSSSEYNVCRNYLDWLTILPWGKHTEEKFDIKHAQQVLDEDHFGLRKLKERILEFIAVGKLKGSVVGKIVCFVGPPGTGKTSIGKSIARALGREFYRFSVGGMSDVAEIKGHRRTYVGAMPGKLIQVMKQSKSANPVIMIDEIDKLGRGHGDPASALLEVLDPEQNSNFVDHYLDVPVDLSKVLFVCTANSLDTIPRPLLDRMEVLRLAGYIMEEKLNIAKKHLLPKMLQDTGVQEKQIKLDDAVLAKLIKEYCREAGVRNLQQQIEKVFRKVAFKLASGAKAPISITMDNLEEFLGKPLYSKDRLFVTTPYGVVMGMAWTEMGGAVLYIETTVEHGSQKEDRGSLKCTGKMGDVMKESTSISYTYAKKVISEKQPENNFFTKHAIHMHIPEGATPKDGPSAGITMTTALLSLAMNKPVKHNLSMTGELTLTGRVLEIGGVKEKTIGARRSGVKDIIFPATNKKDWDELDAEIKEGLTVHFVDTYEDVYQIAFGYEDDKNKAAIDVDAKLHHEAQLMRKQIEAAKVLADTKTKPKKKAAK